jgi:hypothetical protein
VIPEALEDLVILLFLEDLEDLEFLDHHHYQFHQ